jgi:hypothetical protein
MKQRTPFSLLAICPYLIADTVCTMVYTCIEGQSDRCLQRYSSSIAETEARRQKMTPEMRETFSRAAEKWCEDAYNVRAKWFETIANAKDEKGRDRLYRFASHWLASYLNDPEKFMNDRFKDQQWILKNQLAA